MASSTGSNVYYWCLLSAECPYAQGAPFLPPRVRSAFSGGRAAWVQHVLSAVSAADLQAAGVAKVTGTGCIGPLSVDCQAVQVALSHLNEARMTAAKKELKLEAERAGGRQVKLHEAREREIARRDALTEQDVLLAVAAGIVSCAAPLSTVDNPEYREALRQAHDLGWQRGFIEGQATAAAATVKGGRQRDVQPQSLQLPQRTALTRTLLPRLAARVDDGIKAVYVR